VIAAVVLAAGTGSRFGGTKQLATYGGRPLVRHAVDAARGAGIEEVVVVVGHDADSVAAAAGEVRVVSNPRYAEGLSTSLAAGLCALGPEVDSAVVLLADQPGIDADLVRTLLVGAEHREEPIVRLRFADGPGPALLRRPVWDQLNALEGDVGARVLIDDRPDLVFEVPIGRPAPRDVDTPADLERTEAVCARTRSDAGNEKPPSF
jgi:molybdenum cofactor cytidylyltransferase